MLFFFLCHLNSPSERQISRVLSRDCDNLCCKQTRKVRTLVLCHILYLYELHSLFVYYGKQGLDTFDDGYVDGIYLLRLNQDVVAKSAGF